MMFCNFFKKLYLWYAIDIHLGWGFDTRKTGLKKNEGNNIIFWPNFGHRQMGESLVW